MPLYEYRCESCEKQFEATQSIHARPEDTVCPHCKAQKATRLLSSFASKVVGDHKPGFSEMKAYDMLNQRVDKFKKLPAPWGKRLTPAPDALSNPGFDSGSPTEGGNSSGS